jgi:hypothetical protein
MTPEGGIILLDQVARLLVEELRQKWHTGLARELRSGLFPRLPLRHSPFPRMPPTTFSSQNVMVEERGGGPLLSQETLFSMPAVSHSL